LLLSDPDFRLRYQRGQIRVVFSGAAGRAIARQRVGIGEKVVLDLNGGRWLGTGNEGLATVRTPGKSVEGEIGFEDVLSMMVVKGDKEILVRIEEQDMIKDPNVMKRKEAPSTPARGLGRGATHEQIYSSPAFMKRLRASGGETSSPLIDQMEKEDNEELDSEIARKRRRVSYKNVTEWKVARDEKKEPDETVGLGLNLAADVEREAEDQVAEEDVAIRDTHDPITESTDEVHQELPEPSSGLVPVSSPSLQPQAMSKPQTQAEDDDTLVQAIMISFGELPPERDGTNRPAPEEKTLAEAAQDPMAVSPTVSIDFASAMAPPPLPHLEIPQTGTQQQIPDQTGPVTPRLIPVSPGSLPLPSPFPHTPLGIISPSIIQASTAVLETQNVQSADSSARPEYFDRPRSESAAVLAESEQSRSDHERPDNPRSTMEKEKEIIDPLAEAPRRSSVASSDRDAASSPSSGSEADVSSDDENGSESEIARPQEGNEHVDDVLMTTSADVVGSAYPAEVIEGEVVYQEENIVLAEHQDSDALIHTSDGRGSVSLSDRTDDDAEDDLEQDLGHSQMQVLEDVVMLDDASDHEDQYDSSSTPASKSPDYASREESAGVQDQDLSFHPSLGLDGAFASKMQDVTPAPAISMQTWETVVETADQDQPQLDVHSVRSSQDEDAAWAALDEAVTTVRGQEADRLTTESSVGVFAQTVEKDDQPDSQHALESQSPPGPADGLEAANDYDEGAIESNDRYEPKMTSQKLSFVKRMEAFRETSQRSRRSPSIEEVDLSQVEPDYMNAYLSQTLSQTLPQTLRPAAMVESERSTVPAFMGGDSESVYRGDLDTDFGQYVTETVEKVSVSQEVEFADYLQAQTITSESGLVMKMIKQERQTPTSPRQAEDEAIDDELLLEFVNEDSEGAATHYSDPASENINAEAFVDPGNVEDATTFIDGDTTRMNPSNDSESVAEVGNAELPESDNADAQSPSARYNDPEPQDTNAEVAADHGDEEDATTFSAGGNPKRTLDKTVTNLSRDKSSPNVGRQLRSQAEELNPMELAEDDSLQPVSRSVPETAPTLHACRNCAKRKTKCEGRVPCTRCSDRNLRCTRRPTGRSIKDASRMALITPETPAAGHIPPEETRLANDTAPRSAQSPMFQFQSQAEELRMKRFAEDFASVASDLEQTPEAPPEVTSPQTLLSPIPEELITTPTTNQPAEELRLQRFAEDFASVASELNQASRARSEVTLPQTALLPIPEEPITTPVAKHFNGSIRRPPRYSRLSLNTEALSDWFTPPKAIDRRKTTTALPTDTPTTPRPPRLPLTTSQTRSVSPPPMKRFSQTPGTATKLSYFTPLTNLETFLNDPLTTIDVLAVVCDKATDPVRAKSGPRDWFTVFSIVDPDLLNQSTSDLMTAPSKVHGVRVEIYRPWKASLPRCSVGDVVLLRGFSVKSRKHTPYLLSGDASAWVVWRYDGETDEDTDAGRAKRSSLEEVRGPPVEFGEQERVLAGGLRAWWGQVQGIEVENGGLIARTKGKGRAIEVENDVLAKL